MGRTLEEMIAAEAPDVRARIEARALELAEEAEGLTEIRKLSAHTQVGLAEKLRVKQPSVSRMERQADMYLSTLREYVEAAGGTLRLVVTLPNRAPVILTGLGELSKRPAVHLQRTMVKKPAKAPSRAVTAKP